MAELKKITEFLDNYLKIGDIRDDCWNGLQIEGAPIVKKVALAVDAGIDTFKKAMEEKAEMVIVHHGHFWRSENPSFSEWSKKRIELLFRNDISLYAAHLPLDRHRVVGNNVQLLKLLGAKINGEFSLEHGKNVGWTGELKKPLTMKEIEKILTAELKAKCIALPFGKEKVKTIAVCSGGGNYDDFFEALNKGVDLYLSGDAVEIYLTAKDAKFNTIFVGHHATETVGLRALAKVIGEKFGVRTVFIDIPTGL